MVHSFTCRNLGSTTELAPFPLKPATDVLQVKGAGSMP
jgi:hypothetical protein